MKKLFFLLIAAGATLSAIAQTATTDTNTHMVPQPKKAFTSDGHLPAWVIDVNGLGGVLTQDLKATNTLGNYNNVITSVSNNGGELKFDNGRSFGFDAQVGYFFGRSRRFGIGAGFMYLYQQGDLTMSDKFHVEYQSTDANGDVFRQVVSSQYPIKETQKITNINIPVLLKYKVRFSKVLGFTADAGALVNLQTRSSYQTNASFNYEAIYQRIPNGDGSVTSVYDNSPAYSQNDQVFLINKYVPTNQTVEQYFNATLPAKGYNTGIGVKPGNNSGSFDYTMGSIGFIVRPQLSFYLSDMVALNVGGYYLYQPEMNTVKGSYQLTNKVGDYSSVLNTVNSGHSQSYGGNVGLRFYFGRKFVPVIISSADAMDPSACGMNDGSIVLHGLIPNKPVAVDYTVNGATNSQYTGTVEPTGNVKLTNLGGGEYSNITATIGREKANTANVTLVNPTLKITSENSTDPTTYGECNGTITLYGLQAGKPVTVSYNVNGAPQKFTGYVASNNTVTLTRLCAGTYTGITAAQGNCTASGTDITLNSPAPPAPPAPAKEPSKIPTPILFEVNRTVIQQTSYPILEDAVKKIKEDKDSYIEVDGYTDNTGHAAYNKKLSIKRANAVKAQLKKMGVDPKRVRIVGHGSKNPAADNKTPEGRMQNRRAVMHLWVKED
jgi:outer membrane protein OmpA-like peptidoglycan-associated protein